MPRISSRLRPLTRLGAAMLIWLNLGSQMADVMAYLRPRLRGDSAERSAPYVLVEDREGKPLTWDCSKPIPSPAPVWSPPCEVQEPTVVSFQILRYRLICLAVVDYTTVALSVVILTVLGLIETFAEGLDWWSVLFVPRYRPML